MPLNTQSITTKAMMILLIYNLWWSRERERCSCCVDDDDGGQFAGGDFYVNFWVMWYKWFEDFDRTGGGGCHWSINVLGGGRPVWHLILGDFATVWLLKRILPDRCMWYCHMAVIWFPNFFFFFFFYAFWHFLDISNILIYIEKGDHIGYPILYSKHHFDPNATIFIIVNHGVHTVTPKIYTLIWHSVAEL